MSAENSTMLATRFTGPGEPLELVEIPRREPGPGEALVRVRAVGICRSDLHIIEGHTPTAPPPLTLGHEVSGTVETVHDDTESTMLGQHVYIDPTIGCGKCRHCARDEANYCAQRRTIGIHVDGGLAEFITVPIANLVPIPEGISFAESAIIDSASVVEHALRLLEVMADDSVVVIGAGGLGMQAVRLAVLRAARVIVIDTDPVARDRCLAAGAVLAVDPRDDTSRDLILEKCGNPNGVDHVIDCVGSSTTTKDALELLDLHGQLAIVGIGTGTLELTPPAHFVRRSLRVYGIYGSARRDIERIVNLLSDGSFRLAPSVSRTISLREVNEGVAAFNNRADSPVRVVVEP